MSCTDTVNINSTTDCEPCEVNACQADSCLPADSFQIEACYTTDAYQTDTYQQVGVDCADATPAGVCSDDKTPVPDFSEYGKSYVNGQGTAPTADVSTNLVYGERNMAAASRSDKQEWNNYSGKALSDRSNAQLSPRVDRPQARRDAWASHKDTSSEYAVERASDAYGPSFTRALTNRRAPNAAENHQAPYKTDIYQQAMDVLMSKHATETEKTILDVYIERQRKYQALCYAKELALNKAEAYANGNNTGATEDDQASDYQISLAATGKALDYEIAKAYEDWAVNGRKVEVEHWLSVCDNDIPLRNSEANREVSSMIPYPGAPYSGRQRYYYVEEEDEEFEQFEFIEPYFIPRYYRRPVIVRAKPVWTGQAKRVNYDGYEKKLQYERALREAYGKQQILPEITAVIEVKERAPIPTPSPEEPVVSVPQVESPMVPQREPELFREPEAEPTPVCQPAFQPHPEPVFGTEPEPEPESESESESYIESGLEPELVQEPEPEFLPVSVPELVIVEPAYSPEYIDIPAPEPVTAAKPEILEPTHVCQHCDARSAIPSAVSLPFNLVLEMAEGKPSLKLQPSTADSGNSIATSLTDALRSALAQGATSLVLPGTGIPTTFDVPNLNPNELLSGLFR